MVDRLDGRLHEWFQGLSLEARLLTLRAKRWIDETQWAEVLHVFARSCNLINDQGEIISLVTSQLDAGPFAIVVEEDAGSFDKWLQAGEQVQVSPLDLELSGRRISLRMADHWDPRLPWANLRSALGALLAHLPQLESYLHLYAPKDSMSALLQLNDLSEDTPEIGRGAPLSDQFLAAARGPANSLCEGVVNHDAKLIAQGARGLAGLGGGLTPAGDDYLMGCLHATWLIHSQEKVRSIAAIIVDCAAPRTTRLSTAWLQAAQRGEAGMRWHHLFRTFMSDDPAYFQPAVQELVSVGHTSGADALTGFLAVLNFYQQNQNS